MGTEERKISRIEISGKELSGKELSGNEISGNEISEKEAFLVIFDQGLECLGLNVTDEQKNLFYRYYRLVIETNQVMNLTSITDPEEFVYKHLIDSLSLVKVLPNLGEKMNTVIDIGTGAGFPGTPLAIIYPNLQISLNDTLMKRMKFLERVVEELGLKNVSFIYGRAEENGKKEQYREHYDLCVSRAVSNLSTLSEYCLPFIHISGLFIPYKSGKLDEEIPEAGNALKILGGKVNKIVEFQLPKNMGDRKFAVIEKVKATPKKYPRKPGTPAKEPL